MRRTFVTPQYDFQVVSQLSVGGSEGASMTEASEWGRCAWDLAAPLQKFMPFPKSGFCTRYFASVEPVSMLAPSSYACSVSCRTWNDYSGAPLPPRLLAQFISGRGRLEKYFSLWGGRWPGGISSVGDAINNCIYLKPDKNSSAPLNMGKINPPWHPGNPPSSA